MLIAFPIYITIFLMAIVALDGMECFLHANRLHWVEFNSKFLKGGGYLFKEVNFAKELDLEENN